MVVVDWRLYVAAIARGLRWTPVFVFTESASWQLAPLSATGQRRSLWKPTECEYQQTHLQHQQSQAPPLQLWGQLSLPLQHLTTLHWLPAQTSIEYNLPTLCHSYTTQTQVLFICLVFFMCTLHQNSFAPLLTQEIHVFHILRLIHLDIALFPMLLLLSGIPYLVKSDTFSRPLYLKPLWSFKASKISNHKTHPNM